MQFHKAIEQKRSVREFKNKHLENKEIYSLQEYAYQIEYLQDDIITSFHFIEDGYKAYESLLGSAGYYGMTICAPHYLLII